ncbi:hypothetical protein NC797_07900 [Aquibacillus sp. 3ASR75-11]|uniref:Uncharacterized protein n=1 Tax=Terrihalobacillus insolitus TaxID=2950438 RepID=A0A9X3WRH8_9BACI|nr:hypothetical protein [Terrihalobacillus insolitus]MDC3424430.1 hypothetical protein [Terrihalobacillus insolitus]
MHRILVQLMKDLVNNQEEILENQHDEYIDLVEISNKLLGKSYSNSFSINTRKDIDSLVNNEKTIDKYIDFIREKWQERVFYHTYKFYKSPEYGQLKWTIDGRKIDFEYERTLNPLELEEKIHKSYEDYEGFSILFSNGMSSLKAVFSVITKLLGHKSDEIKGLSMFGYFESISLSLEYRKFLDMDYIINEDDYSKYDIEKYDFFIIEPVRTTFYLNITNIEKFLIDLSNFNDNSLKMVVFDSSLLGEYFNIFAILDKLKRKKNLIIINIRSGLKLDQQGMEFSNCGLANIYIEKSSSKIKDYIQKYMIKYRKITGTGLSFNEVCLLDNDVCFTDKSYAEKILNNNRDFCERLIKTKKGTVSEIIYPYNRQRNDIYKTPYLFLKLTKDNREEYEKLFSIIKSSLEHFNLNLISRNSFGFRNITLEYFMNLEDNSLVFKFAVGKLKGIKYYIILLLLNNILSTNQIEFDRLYTDLVSLEDKNEFEK